MEFFTYRLKSFNIIQQSKLQLCIFMLQLIKHFQLCGRMNEINQIFPIKELILFNNFCKFSSENFLVFVFAAALKKSITSNISQIAILSKNS